ncbi:MAG: hypothetical protein BJ554DRAFT_4696 [Olpidium bornovanus]|uniref:Uncharacterized protein n=1 Tax=Olpidium bornovanus TaxID=278681 RepID=A0A8H7ZZS7_9FUNG|nr:MAG: hypothetical protein BJ554DRAFT_4696 [Olpidium bornovanus]
MPAASPPAPTATALDREGHRCCRLPAFRPRPRQLGAGRKERE